MIIIFVHRYCILLETFKLRNCTFLISEKLTLINVIHVFVKSSMDLELM